jgi:hypothetical protein
LSITIWFQFKAKFYPQIPQRWKVSSLETVNKSSNFITNWFPAQAKILSSNHTQINIDHQRTNKENYYECQPYLIVIGAGLDRISLLFKRMEENLNPTVPSHTSFHLPLYFLNRGSLCKLKNAVLLNNLTQYFHLYLEGSYKTQCPCNLQCTPYISHMVSLGLQISNYIR